MLGLCVPLNLALLCAMRERGTFNLHGLRRIGVLAIEAALTAWLAYGAGHTLLAQLYAPLFDPALFATPLPHTVLVACMLAIAICLGCWMVRRSPLDLAFAGATAAVALALHRTSVANAFAAFVAAGGLLFIIALLQDSFRMAFRDELTGLPSRRDLNERMMGLGRHYVIAMLDVDHFKKFNDSWGHQTGDQVLRLVASCLSENVKGRDTAARYGGEEFAVLLRGTPLEAASMLANQIRTTVETKKLVKKSTGDVLGTITISIGVAKFSAGESSETVLRRADACLYGAKHSGRNLVIHQNDARMAALETSAA